MNPGDSLSGVSYIVLEVFSQFHPKHRSTGMFTLSVFVGLDYHTKTIQVCVMDQKGKILAVGDVRIEEWEKLRYSR